MKILSSLIAVASLLAATAFVPIYGGVLFAFILFGAFLLALVGAIGEQQDRTVRQHDTPMDPTAWRKGPRA